MRAVKPASGRFVLRLPPELHARARKAASARGQSLNEYCVAVLQAASGAYEREPPWMSPLRAELGPSFVGALLFGSTARGTQRESSDVDVLIVLEPGAPITRELYRRWDRVVGHGGAETPHFVSLPRAVGEAGGLWYEAAMDGIILHDQHHRLARFLAEIRRAAAAGIIRREVAHGHPYWVRGSEASSSAQ